MKRIAVPIIGVFLLALLAVAASLAQTTLGEGKAVYDKRCKMCHGADGKGNAAMARMLKVEFHSMDSEYVQKLTDEEIKNAILKGKGKMAAVRGISEPEIAAVTAHIRSQKKQPGQAD